MSDYDWRFAIKKYDTTKKISSEDMESLLYSLRYAPSAFNIQPWKFLVIEDPTMRAKLREAAYGQAQVTDASHFIVLARQTIINDAFLDRVVEETAKVRGMQASDLAEYRNMISGMSSLPPDAAGIWASKQVYLALGSLISTAARMHIDASPMEGFDATKFDEILGLTQKGLASVVICALGYRSPDDKYPHMKKMRFEMSQTVERI